ncbi:pyridoxal kinase [Cardiosporidium cionae]|uniref:pyridoxal kinase n=1 Tax=Cardiosporidium cionae TaxID=476202 RepID=A0ABQ7J4I8_9APIC|nr:pyridoxal kinase [Cardiosporidium cionae]|eukprot:KAF8817946.1 pyridoxal kinase [Cardiosporidium cionae]
MAPESEVNEKVVSPLRILSLQSHVIRGYVGNRAAAFPLQRLGHHVDTIDSVSFASMYIHEGFSRSGDDLNILLEGILKAFFKPTGGGHPGAKVDGIGSFIGMPNEGVTTRIAAANIGLDYTHVLTGYIGDPSFLANVIEIVAGLKNPVSAHGNRKAQIPLWLCDPVLGDNDKLYVSEELLAIYKQRALPYADIITPNQFEAQWLSGIKIQNLQDARACINKLHDAGPQVVIITSTSVVDDPGYLYLIASQRAGCHNGSISNSSNSGSSNSAVSIRFKDRKVFLGGTGDLMSALLLHSLQKFSLAKACEVALSTVQAIMEHTLAAKEPMETIDVIGGQNYIENPPLPYTAKEFV